MKTNSITIQQRVKILGAIIPLLLLSSNLLAQFTMSGDIRPRAEYRNGYKTLVSPNHDAATFIDQRTRMNLNFMSQSYTVKVSLQDIRVWGSQPQLNTTDGLTSLHEGWGEVFFSSRISLKTGRQEIAYDDHRIFGNVGWAQQARSHDAAIFKIKSEDYTAHLGLAYNQDGASLSGTIANNSSYKAMQYLWFNRKLSNLNASFLFLNNGKQGYILDTLGNITGGQDYYSQTFGGRLEFKPANATIHLAGYLQRGEEADVAHTAIEAYNLKIDGSLPLSDNFKATLGVELLSGNSELEANTKNHAFNPFYGTNHKFNGHMDYFFVGNHINSVGLNDYFLSGVYKKGAYTFAADLHFFQSNTDVLDDKEFASTGKSIAANNHLGTEIDMSLAYSVANGVSLKMGYSYLKPTETLSYLKGGSHDERNDWAWLMIVFKPSFIGG